jgi:hypothetical protein
MKTAKLLVLAKYTAFYTFLVGTFIVTAYYLGGNSIWFLIGYFYILLAFIINLAVLLLLLWRVRKDRANSRILIKHAAFLFINMPVMVAYIWFVLVLLNTMRITFTNETGQDLGPVHITGCQEKYIDHLSKGESRSAWIHITSDCAIRISYLLKGKEVNQDVFGYCTPSGGEKINYKIGGDNSETEMFKNE